MRDIRFALGYLPHRIWGNILQAQFLEKEPGKEFYVPREYIQNDEYTGAYQRLTPMQREVIKLLDCYSDRNLYRIFSKDKSVKEFQASVDKEIIQNQIRPYIERYIYDALLIARDNRFAIFIREKSNRNVFPEDFIVPEKHFARPLFYFRYRDHLSYSLDLYHNKNLLNLRKGFAEIVSNEPASLILGDKLYFISEINGRRVKPFLTKREIIIPEEMEVKYFSSFVKNTLRDYNVITEGFSVKEVTPDSSAEITVEMGLNNQPVWILSFLYNNQVIYPDSKLKRFVSYSFEENLHTFSRYPRDPQWEENKVETLNELGLRSRDQKSFYLNNSFNKGDVTDIYRAINFLNENKSILIQAGFKVTDRLPKNYYLGEIDLDLVSSEKEDWFDIYALVRLDDQSIPFLLLRENIIQGNREYDLPDGSILVLPEEWLVRFRAVFEFGKSDGDHILIHRQHFSMVEGPVRDFHEDTLATLEKLNERELIPDLSLPENLNADLRNYQIEGYKWLCFLQQNGLGGYLADDMGLGKTLQAIAVLLRSREYQKRTSLIILPASLLHNWLNEFRRFAAGIKIYSYTGGQRNRELSNFTYYDVILSTYHTVRQDIEILSEFLFHYIILDESQMIKNPSSKLYQAIIDLRSEHRIVLTGTPIENSLTDLWSQVNFINPGLLGTLSFFKRSFVYPIERKKDSVRESKLKELINPFILRRTKQEVATELPPVFEQVRYCSMTADQRRIYEEEKSMARNSILENLEDIGLNRSSIMVLQALTRLRQIANHPDLIEDYSGNKSGKFAEVYRNIHSIISEGHKVLIFSSFVKHLDIYRSRLDEDRVNYVYLTGSQNQKQRERAVAEFQRKNGCSIFLISLKAGGVGLNLTAADYVFILDPWWNPAAEIQALNRAHRIGQEKNVFVYRFISNDTIEEKIRRMQTKKQELAETFISSSNPLRNISEEELLELFN